MLKKIRELREEYYNREDIQDLLLRYMQDREVCFMDKDEPWKCIRLLFCKDKYAINWLFNFYDFFQKTGRVKNNYNIYVSNARYDYIPKFDFNLHFRSKQTNTFFKDNAYNNVIEFDLLLDFDFKPNKWKELKQEVFKVCKILDTYKICFNMFPSGRGFQIIIPSEQISFADDCLCKKKFYQSDTTKGFNSDIDFLRKLIEHKMILNFLCQSPIKTLSKLRKCEFSLVNTTICYPLDYETLNSFEYKDIEYKKDYKGGFQYKYYNLENLHNCENFTTFIKEGL